MQNNTRYKIQDTRYKNGFTLVETLVGVAIFAIVITISFGVFTYVLQSHKRVLAYQETLDQAGFAMEYMTRSIRAARKQEAGNTPIGCIALAGFNYQLISSSHIRFIRWDHVDASYICYEFYLHGKELRVERDYAPMGKEIFPLTSLELEVTNLKFEVVGDGIEAAAQIQPRVTIVLEVKGREYAPGRRPIIHFQTTVSQRDLDFPLVP